MKEKIYSLSTLLLKIYVKVVSSYVCNAPVNVNPHPPPPPQKKICVYELAIRPICPGLAHLTKWNRLKCEAEACSRYIFYFFG